MFFFDEYNSVRESLTDTQLGAVFRACMEAAQHGTGFDTADALAQMAFNVLMSGVSRAAESYERRSRTNRDNINKRWHPDDTIEYDGNNVPYPNVPYPNGTERSESVTNASLSPLWDAYPEWRRGDRDEANKAFAEVYEDENTIRQMLHSLSYWKKSDQWRDREYVPGLAKWLREGMWKVSDSQTEVSVFNERRI